MQNVARGHYEDYLKKQMESGRYDNASEVIHAGLRLLEDHKTTRERWLSEEIPVRYNDLIQSPSIGV